MGEEVAEEPSGMRAIRRVHVHRTWCEPGMESDPKMGISLFAHVEALGLRWQTLLVEVRLRTPDGKPVHVQAGAPERYADQKGRFYMSARAPVFLDRFAWKGLRASIPYEKVLDLPPQRPLRLIATFGVSCQGLSSMSEAEVTIPPEPAAAVRRAVRLLAIDPLANSRRPDAPKRADESPGEPGSGGPASKELGLMVEAYVEAVGVSRSKMIGRLGLRRADGKPFTWQAPDGKSRPVEHRVQSDVVADQAQILLHFVSYRALGLEPGRHRLILSYSADCDGLRATIDEEHLVPVAAPGDEAWGRSRPKDATRVEQ